MWKFLKSKFGIPEEEIPKALPWNFGYSDEPKEYDWDDWKVDMQAKYPVRYWIFHELNIWASVKYRIWVTDPWYWFTSIFIKKQHLLDLRKGEWSKDDMRYKYGYADPGNALEYAVYASFLNYLEELDANHGPGSWRDELCEIDHAAELSGLDKCIKNHQGWVAEENAKDDDDPSKMMGNTNHWLDHYIKIKEIKEFFETELPRLERESIDRLMSRPKNCTREESLKHSIESDKFDTMIKDRTTENMCEIIRLRGGMWT